MSGYFLKNPGSKLDYTFDWGFQLFETGETIAADLGWEVVPDEGASTGLVVETTSSTPTTTTAHLSAGRPGEVYLVSSAIRTSLGREVRRSLTVRVANN